MEWINVSKKTPDENKKVLGYCFNEKFQHFIGVCEVTFSINLGWKYTYGNEEWLAKRPYITHWMPIPEDPPDSKRRGIL